MPNWCTNRLEVYGPTDELQKFAALVTGSVADKHCPLRFESLLPVPSEVEPANQYDWKHKNWGTRWDLDGHTDILASPDQITYSFDTAWTPPDKWVLAAAERFPKLRFDLYYYELGNFFAGGLECRDGEPRNVEEYTEEAEVSEFVWDYFNFNIDNITAVQ